MLHSLRLVVVLLSIIHVSLGSKTYCQPAEPCWPSVDEINQLKGSLSQPLSDCLKAVPTFTSQDEKGPLIFNTWYTIKVHFPKKNILFEQPSFRYDELNVLIYAYTLLLQRHHISDAMPFFAILPRTAEDVSKAVQFAAKHNLAFSVFSTGHEFQDRNAPLAPNGLLIRTTCLRTVEIDLDPANKFGHEHGVSSLRYFLSFVCFLSVFLTARNNS